MKRGLVIGKFMPLHKGHIALIEFAASRCDELIVSMSYTDADPIEPQLRFKWIKEQFKNNSAIVPYIIKDDFDNEHLPLQERTAAWAKKMEQAYPPVDILISSENYGEPFALNMSAAHIVFDMQRSTVPISATAIRNEPLANWQYIPIHIQPYFVKKICFYGPESTGKSTLAMKMAEHYNTVYVPESARDILQSNDFGEKEIIAIGRLQHQYIQEKLQQANKFLFCDTDAITTAIYAQLYLRKVPPVITELEKQTRYDLYFLLDIDTPWIADPLRDQGHRRKEMMKIFKNELEERKIEYVLISGSYEERERKVRAVLDEMMVNKLLTGY
ncbi:MAG: AAA family ATPase [Chitinophagaceae bacterium]|nr:AAA family ATPase [Chitinophagaceae bacterium]